MSWMTWHANKAAIVSLGQQVSVVDELMGVSDVRW
jgi:hypothetical protein